jgi:hypothetical protein
MSTFISRKPNVTKEWQEKLPDFVRRLEEALYRNATSLVRAPGHLGWWRALSRGRAAGVVGRWGAQGR